MIKNPCRQKIDFSNFFDIMRFGKPRQCYSWLRKYFWFKEKSTAFYIQYGIEEEHYAIQAYSKSANISIRKSGLWVNKNYPHLGASPDGLVYDSQENLLGIIEVKCLKALKDQTVLHHVLHQMLMVHFFLKKTMPTITKYSCNSS